MTTVIGERELRRQAPEIVPLMDQEVRALGRSTSARTAALEHRDGVGPGLEAEAPAEATPAS
jgi:hypothetical protein